MGGMDDDRSRRWEALDSRLEGAVRPYRREPSGSASRPRPMLAILLVGAALLCVAFATAPLFAFRAVRSAAEFGDVQALGQLVDYNAVRQSLRTQVRPASAERRPPADLLRDPIGALRRAWEPASPQADVDRYLTPESIAALAQGRGAPAADAPLPGSGLWGGPVPAVRFWSTDRVRLGVADPARRAPETIFTFERRKMFTWRLVGVRLPRAAATASQK
jgi:hypothetical protein